MRWTFAPVFFLIAAGLVTCQTKDTPVLEQPSMNPTENEKEVIYVNDPHSYANPKEALITHLDWEATVDFESQSIRGVARLTIEKKEEAEELILDSKGLIIEKVTLGLTDHEIPTGFDLKGDDPILGSALEIELKGESPLVNIYYQTSPEAQALQWLTPEQTADKSHPFLFTQSQAILARSWLPIQDSPGIRFTYQAEVTVPAELLALMSAANPMNKNDTGVYQFTMDQAIPAYLMALAVGDLTFASLGDRTGVYAEASVIEKAKAEFAELPQMLLAAEKLYGPYQWERYDLLVLPPSFPFGGMENPRLTFATPTILAGDRSLVSLVAHELAHSWSGNLVTNATWDDFWLNEGFTVYFENRIMEALQGRDYSEMLALLALQDLEAEVDQLTADKKEKDSHLKLDLADRDPDEGMTSIAYDKGYYFLRWLEERAGRENFDAFLKKYFEDHAFTSMTTSNFVEYLDKNLIQQHHINLYDDDYNQWIYGPGLPEALPRPVSDRFEKVGQDLQNWLEGAEAKSLETESWSTHEWLYFIRNLPDSLTSESLTSLDLAFDFTHSGNAEIQAIWFEKAIAHQYEPAYAEMEHFLIRVGRRKFLSPLYKAMAKTTTGMGMAKKIYAQARPNYHSVARSTIDQILDWDTSE